MKITIKCKECRIEYEIEADAVKKDKYIQCPYCGRQAANPLFET